MTPPPADISRRLRTESHDADSLQEVSSGVAFRVVPSEALDRLPVTIEWNATFYNVQSMSL